MAPLNRIVEVGSKLLAGALLLASILNAAASVAPINTPGLALIGSIVIGTIWLALELSTKKFGLRWETKNGNGDVKLRRLGKGPRLAAVGAISLLWVHPALNLFRPPVEVTTLPHVLYDYASNYPDKYFRFKKVRYDLSEKLFSVTSSRKTGPAKTGKIG